MALTGTLQDVPLDELASLLQQQNRTGVLKITLNDGEVDILFREGMICQVDDTRRSAGMLIGEMLFAAGLIGRSDLARALEEQLTSTKSKPLGAILVANKAIQPSDLTKRLDLQFRETLYQLYMTSQGDFEFDPDSSALRPLSPPPIPVEDVTMEAMRRIDELPEIDKTIRAPNIPFLQVKSILLKNEELASYPQRERTVFNALDEPSTIEQLVGRTCLSSFDVKKALLTLLGDKFIVPVDLGADQSPLPSRTSNSWRSFMNQHAYGTRVLVQFVVTSLITTIILIVGVRSMSSPILPDDPLFPLEAPFSETRHFFTQSHLEQLHRAIEVFRLESGHWPNGLDALLEQQLIEHHSSYLSTFENPFFYRQHGNSYILLPPKR